MIRRTILTLLPLLSLAVSFAQTANFTASPTTGCAPLVVNFQDLSTGGVTSWFWDFGNGATSTLKNPSTTYFNPGAYTVKLTVTNAQGSNTLTRTSFISIFNKPTVNFKVSDSTGCFPLRAQFTDMSVPSPGTTNASYVWDFGDGTQSNQQNPLHVYTVSGNFPVTLKVTNDKGCVSVISRANYINISGGVTSAFSNNFPTTCHTPITINFSNASTGPGTLTWFWNFGDGNTSTQQNPSHTYTSPGNYSVSLATTSTTGCTDTLVKANLIALDSINSSFTAPDTVCINVPVTFQNTSTSQQGSFWTFGDGTSSSDSSPVKVYTTVGNYTVRLVNTYSYCTDSVSKNILVLPLPVADFRSADTIRCQPPLTVNFQDLSTNAAGWQWDFGDGGTSNLQNPTHTYSSYGTFDVQLIVTSVSGCTDTIRKRRYIKIARPQISIAPIPAEGCIPYTFNPVASITSLDAVTSYLWDFGDGTTSSLVTPSHNYPVQGTFTVKLTITTSTGCTDSLVIPGGVKVGRKPVIDFTAAPNPVCAFLPVQFTDLTNEGDQWYWQFGDGFSSTLKNPVHDYSDTGLFTVRLMVVNNGCRDSLRKDDYMRIKPPISKFGYVNNCTDRHQFQFVDSSIGATTWFWDFGDGTTSTAQNPVHTFPAYTTYMVSLTVTNDTCSHKITKAVKVINEVPNFLASNTVACRIANISFNVTNIDPQNILVYAWDFGNGAQDSSIPSPYHSSQYVNSGNYSVRLITTDIHGCRDTVNKVNYLRINGPVANFNATNTNGCKGLTTTFNDLSTSDGVSNIVNWKWDFGDGTVQNFTSGPFQHTYPNPGTYTVKLVVTDAGGCKDSLVSPDLVKTTDPKATFYAVDTLACPGSSVQFVNTSSGTDLSFSWEYGDGNGSTFNSPAHIYQDSGYYSVKLKVWDLNLCSDSTTKVNYIRVSRPVADFTMSDSISSCTPFEVQFTNTSHFWRHLSWNIDGSSSGAENPVRYFTRTGTFPVTLVVSSPGGCLDSITKMVTVYDTAGSRVTYLPLGGCKPLSVDLETYSPGPMTYTWDFGDGVLINTTDSTMNHIYNFFGDFVPKVIMTDQAGCIIPVTGKDTIRIIGVTAKFGLDNTLFCDSGLVRFTDSTTYNDSLNFYHWDFGDGNSSSLKNPVHQYTTPGIYTVALDVQTQRNCVDTFRLTSIVKVVQSPLISIAGDTVVCVNDSLQHIGQFDRLDTSAVRWNWRFPNGSSSQLQNPLLQPYQTVGTFPITAIATNSSGCADTTTRNILVNPLPVITMPSSMTMQPGFPILIPATYSPNVTRYSWIPASTLSCSDCPQPMAAPKFNTIYVVSVVDSNGCQNSEQVNVIVICKNANVFIPNTFSPNNDGSNDVFYVRGKGLDRVKSLRIFNRWGEVVFEGNNLPVNNPLYGWDGKFKGKNPVADVYVYQVEVFCENSQVIRFDGNVALIQ